MVIRNQPLDALSERPALDWLMGCIVVGIHALVVTVMHRYDPLASLSEAERVDLYGQAINPASILVGFTLAALAFTYSGEGRYTALLRAHGGRALRRTWLAAISGPLLAVGVLLAAQVVEQNGTATARWAGEIAFVLIALRTTRLVWLLGQLLDLRQLDDVDTKRPAPVPRRRRRTN